MNKTGARIAGTGAGGVVIFVWNGIIGSVFKYWLPEYPFPLIDEYTALLIAAVMVPSTEKVLTNEPSRPQEPTA